ncbi:MAG: hypothetical protein HS132_15405 [Planctomycetia bacterium]|nr:hypothetical protein [Planctomycetia bacterium]
MDSTDFNSIITLFSTRISTRKGWYTPSTDYILPTKDDCGSCKADPEKQKEFIEKYEQLKANKAAEDKILFMDGTHPQHNSMPAYCWIEKGEKKEIPSNTGRNMI